MIARSRATSVNRVALPIDDDRLKGAPEEHRSNCTGTRVPSVHTTVLREVTRHRRGEATGGKNLAWHSGHETKKELRANRQIQESSPTICAVNKDTENN